MGCTPGETGQHGKGCTLYKEGNPENNPVLQFHDPGQGGAIIMRFYSWNGLFVKVIDCPAFSEDNIKVQTLTGMVYIVPWYKVGGVKFGEQENKGKK
jgi:hypothetical protein